MVFMALVALGLAFGETRVQSVVSSSTTGYTMQHFVIIFRQGPRPLTDADKARRQHEVSAWARMQNDAGHKLEPRILGPEVARPDTNLPDGNGVGSAAWAITALVFLEARDLDEAAAIAAAHPAKNFNASVEVRPWAPPVVPAIAPSSR